jgi:hypothetical protein
LALPIKDGNAPRKYEQVRLHEVSFIGSITYAKGRTSIRRPGGADFNARTHPETHGTRPSKPIVMDELPNPTLTRELFCR